MIDRGKKIMNDQRRREGQQIENHRHILNVFVC